METLEETTRAMTSKPAQRAAVNLVLLVSGVATLLGLASLATALFFQNYVPGPFISSPVYLQYQAGGNPYGIAPLQYPPPTLQQDYDVSISLSLPRSPPNTARGNFMVSLSLLKDDSRSYETVSGERQVTAVEKYLENQKILHRARRPALMPYEDPILSVVRRILLAGYYLMFPHQQGRTMTVQLAERVRFDKTWALPTAAFVEIEAGPDIHIYHATLTLTAQLRGLRWLMYHYRTMTYVMFTCMFWICEVLFMCLAWLMWTFTSTARRPARKGGAFTDGDDDLDEQSDRPGSSTVRSPRMLFKREPSVKSEEEDDGHQRTLHDIPVGGLEADDEYEFDDDDDHESSGSRRDTGSGTSFTRQSSEGFRQRATRGFVGKEELS